MALINKLEAIADAIRAKTGGSAELSLDDMVNEIEGISGGSGEKLDLVYNFLNGTVISDYTVPLLPYINSIVIQDTVTTDSTHKNLENMIEFRTTTPTTLPPIILDIAYGRRDGSLSLNFTNCETVKSLDNITLSANFISTMATHGINVDSMFAFNYQLRETPDFLKYINHKYPYNMGSQIVYIKCCYCCYNLEKVVLPVGGYKPLFTDCFTNCFRLSSVKFRTEDNNLPVKLTWEWNNSTIDLTEIGYVKSDWVSTYRKYGDITAQVIDSSSYQSLKNNPNWWTSDIAYSRYNHDSTVETINSLPDCSAVGTNTIKFTGNAGSATDGGAINTLTAEEIAVAAAKGWTVALV